eukprot:4287302-Prymnesium_polylepis.1
MDCAAAVMKKLKADTGAAGVTKLIVHATNAFDREEKLELCALLAAGLPPDAALQLRVGLLSTMAADQLRDVSHTAATRMMRPWRTSHRRCRLQPLHSHLD